MAKLMWILLLTSVFVLVWGQSKKTMLKRSDKDLYEAEHLKLLNGPFNEISTSAMRPEFGGDPVIVTCSITVDSFADLSETTMDYAISLSLYLEWTDTRLSHNSSGEITFQTIETIKKAWLPDVYFFNEKKGTFHNIISENTAFIVYPNGSIIYSVRLTLSLSCFMELYYFPMDRQQCPLLMRSYAYNENNVILQWRRTDDDNATLPIDYSDDIELPQFNLIDVTEDTNVVTLRLGNFSTLCARFTLERVMGFYIVHTYVPSFLLVVISWITFWLHVEATPARASLGITTVLTVTTQVTASRYTLPDVAYPTALDIWFSCCLVFVFSALLEFALVNYVYLLDNKLQVFKRSGSKGSVTATRDTLEMDDYHSDAIGEGTLSSGLRKRSDRSPQSTSMQVIQQRMPLRPYATHARAIDKACRILFPSLFLIFNIFYWSYYLTMRRTIPEYWKIASCGSK